MPFLRDPLKPGIEYWLRVSFHLPRMRLPRPSPVNSKAAPGKAVRWTVLHSPEKAGLLFSMDTPLAFTALHYSPEDLDRATHTSDLNPRKEIIVSLDIAQHGLGNASCGPPALDRYRIQPRRYCFRYTLAKATGANPIAWAEQARKLKGRTTATPPLAP